MTGEPKSFVPNALQAPATSDWNVMGGITAQDCAGLLLFSHRPYQFSPGPPAPVISHASQRQRRGRGDSCAANEGGGRMTTLRSPSLIILMAAHAAGFDPNERPPGFLPIDGSAIASPAEAAYLIGLGVSVVTLALAVLLLWVVWGKER